MDLEPLRRGCVIPAHPLALTAERQLDERRQRALTRYYLAAGAGGLAVGVHTAEFAIHDPAVGLLEPVLALAAEEASGHDVVLIAGVCGPTRQAVAEAELAASLGYHAVLLPPMAELTEDELLDRTKAVGEVLPVVGFYLQPAVGGRKRSREFWTQLAAIPAVVGIKVAPFNRYQTLDVVHGAPRAGRADDVVLYTGNDDHILADLVTTHQVTVDGDIVKVRFAGGLLGQWAVWTHRAVELLAEARTAAEDSSALRRLLTLDGQLTDANAAIFDAARGFRGCLPGIQEVLRRQGLLAGRRCLDPAVDLSPVQLAEIDRIWAAFPHLRDDEFVTAHLDQWLT